MTLRIIHEASTQRQHVRVRAPLIVRIGQTEHTAYDWSVAGIGIRGLDPAPQVGHRVPMALLFRFEGFAFEINVGGEVKHVNPRTSEVGMVLADLEPEQLSLLQYVVGAYLSGELVTSADVMAIAKRENFTGARALKATQPAASKALVVRNLALLAVLWTLGLGLVGLLGVNLYSRAFVISADGFLASQDARLTRAPAAGLLTIDAKAGSRVHANTVVATVQTATGELMPVAAGCDCVVGSPEATNGAFVPAGGQILTLIPTGAHLGGEFLVPLETARRIRPGDKAFVEFYTNGRRERAQVERIVLPAYAQTSAYGRMSEGGLQMNAVVRVKFDQVLPVDLVGQPAAVRINALHLAA